LGEFTLVSTSCFLWTYWLNGKTVRFPMMTSGNREEVLGDLVKCSYLHKANEAALFHDEIIQNG